MVVKLRTPGEGTHFRRAGPRQKVWNHNFLSVEFFCDYFESVLLLQLALVELVQLSATDFSVDKGTRSDCTASRFVPILLQ